MLGRETRRAQREPWGDTGERGPHKGSCPGCGSWAVSTVTFDRGASWGQSLHLPAVPRDATR